jgi:hypothetical protein
MVTPTFFVLALRVRNQCEPYTIPLLISILEPVVQHFSLLWVVFIDTSFWTQDILHKFPEHISINFMNCAITLQKTHFAQKKTFNTHNDMRYMNTVHLCVGI